MRISCTGLTAVLFLVSWPLLLAQSQEVTHRRRSTASVPECLGKKVAVLDLAEFADSAGIPPCNSDTDFKVNSC